MDFFVEKKHLFTEHTVFSILLRIYINVFMYLFLSFEFFVLLASSFNIDVRCKYLSIYLYRIPCPSICLECVNDIRYFRLLAERLSLLGALVFRPRRRRPSKNMFHLIYTEIMGKKY